MGNEIKPVLTIDANTLEMAKVETLRADRVATRPYRKFRVEMGEVALYDQATIDRLTAERDAAVSALDRIVSMKMSVFKDPYDMIGELVSIAEDAINSSRKES